MVSVGDVRQFKVGMGMYRTGKILQISNGEAFVEWNHNVRSCWVSLDNMC